METLIKQDCKNCNIETDWQLVGKSVINSKSYDGEYIFCCKNCNEAIYLYGKKSK